MTELVVASRDLGAVLQFLCEQLGFRVDAIRPADDPRTALISGHGIRLRVDRGSDGATVIVRRVADDAGDAATDPALPLPLPPLAPSFVVTRADAPAWKPGRADMAYRDLIPDRQGGRFIASHIRIAAGGPVPDYVHWHEVRFQLIFCLRGEVELVYEDQGAPFWLAAGDCVLQPPGIRHRVLSCMPGLEVLELGSPADHETRADHDLALPTPSLRPDRDFGGQRFVHHRAAAAPWQPAAWPGFAARDLGLASATAGLVDVQVIRPDGAPPPASLRHDDEILFAFTIAGQLTLRDPVDGDRRLGRDDCFVIPPGRDASIDGVSADTELFVASIRRGRTAR